MIDFISEGERIYEQWRHAKLHRDEAWQIADAKFNSRSALFKKIAAILDFFDGSSGDMEARMLVGSRNIERWWDSNDAFRTIDDAAKAHLKLYFSDYVEVAKIMDAQHEARQDVPGQLQEL